MSRWSKRASATKATTQLFIETIEQRYSVGMVAATVALFAVPLLMGTALQPTLLRAITFMIVASPCAVVLATMPPLLSAIATAGRNGVLVKSAVVMEQLGRTDTVAFDKTGTLTAGRPHVIAVAALDPTRNSEAELLRLAAAAEQPSEHPIAAAIVAAAHRRGPASYQKRTGSTPDPARASPPTSTVELFGSALPRCCRPRSATYPRERRRPCGTPRPPAQLRLSSSSTDCRPES